MPTAPSMIIARDLKLPIDAVTEPTGVFGNRGSGKTNTAVVFVEELLDAGQQAVVIDPTDVWWGLKSSLDGKRPGYPVVVLGGRHADLPLDENDARSVAEFVASENVTVVLSLRHIESHAAQKRFVNAFLRRLYYLKGQVDNPTPIAVILDEAHLFAPQRVMGDDAACLGAVQQVMRQGRSSGLGLWLIDQRTASVNKDVLDLVELMVVHRITGPHNRKALTGWVEQNADRAVQKDFLDTLAQQKDGQAWFWSPSRFQLFRQVQVRERRTFDSSRTPKAGETVIAPRSLAEIDLPALKEKLTATIEKAKADDPGLLRKRIDDLEAQLANLDDRRAVIDPEAMASEHARGRSEGIATERAEWGARIPELEDIRQRGRDLVRQVDDVVGLLGLWSVRAKERATESIVVPEQDNGWPSLDETERYQSERHAREPRYEIAAPDFSDIAERVAFASRPIFRPEHVAAAKANGASFSPFLDAAARLHALGLMLPERDVVTVMAGRSTRSSSTKSAFQKLIANGFLEVSTAAAGRVKITPKGLRAATPSSQPATLAEYHATWSQLLSAKQAEMLRVVIGFRGRTTSREAIASRTSQSMTSSSTKANFQHLIRLGLLVSDTKGAVVGGPLLFPEGLR